MAGDFAQRQRRAVRQLTSGVSVLTFWHDGSAHATTASAVFAVSREPLLIGVCLTRGSRFAGLLARYDRFAVNVLSARQALLASWFADAQRPAGLSQFDPVEWEPDAFSGAPLIAGSLARLSCRRTAQMAAGDHDLLLAEVVSGTAEEGPPLLSFAGQLHDGLLRSLPARPAHPAVPAVRNPAGAPTPKGHRA
ncbi:flavin reductase family protein [Micromonospora maritima]|uniref:Flavin reductase family protein n=1 Tax=Micromonospora maritima TaxID=986711 RepID=A0ABW7ZGW5_9ACTN